VKPRRKSFVGAGNSTLRAANSSNFKISSTPVAAAAIHIKNGTSPYISNETVALLKARTNRNSVQSSSTLFSIKNVNVQPNVTGTVVPPKQYLLRKKSKAKTTKDAAYTSKNVLQNAGKFVV